MSNAEGKLEFRASCIAGSTKCLYSSGEHFNGTSKPPSATRNDQSHQPSLHRKNSFRALRTNRTVLQLRVESPPRIGEEQDRLTHAFSELLFQRLEFPVFLDPNLSVHTEA